MQKGSKSYIFQSWVRSSEQFSEGKYIVFTCIKILISYPYCQLNDNDVRIVFLFREKKVKFLDFEYWCTLE